MAGKVEKNSSDGKKILVAFLQENLSFSRKCFLKGGEIMENENLKIFKICGEYRMTEEDNLKTAKNISLDSAFKILDGEVKNFLRDNFKNLDDDDIPKIAEKFLKKNEPNFVRENLPNNEMICYAYIDAQINLDDLNNFLKNFDFFKLKKRVEELEKQIELYQKFLHEVIYREIRIEKNSNDDVAYWCRGNAYKNLKNYEQAISDYTQAIKLDPNYASAYELRGICYQELGEKEKAEADFVKARKLGYRE